MHSHPCTHPAVEIVPPEVLSRVFVIGANSIHDSSSTFELSVSHVSRRWRSVSIDTQELWGKLSMQMPLDRVWTYVDRSKASKLSIVVNPRHDTTKGYGILLRDQQFREPLDAFLNIVILAAHRWNQLIIHTYSNVRMAHALDRIMRLSVPQLESLQLTQEISGSPTSPIVGSDIFQSFLSGACSLGLVRFELVYLPWLSFSAINLRELDIGGLSHRIAMNYDQMRQVFTSSPRLVTLALTGTFPSIDGRGGYPPIVLPALDHLQIFSLDASHNDLSIFHLLSTPVLTSLMIGQVEDLNGFISDVNTTPPKYPFVTSLSLMSISLPLENTDIFSAFPNVSHLDVTGTDMSSLFEHWSHQTIYPDKSVVWSNIKTLYIDRKPSSDIALTQIIKFRMEYGRPLMVLCMTERCCRSYSARMLQWLNEKVAIDIYQPCGVSPVDILKDLEEQGMEDPDEVGLGFGGHMFNPYGEMDEPFPKDSNSTTLDEPRDMVDDS